MIDCSGGSNGCSACPFSLSEAAEQAQNWGCLPSPAEIMALWRDRGKNWGCHEDETRVCRGFAAAMTEAGLPVDPQAEIASYKRWYHLGPEAA